MDIPQLTHLKDAIQCLLVYMPRLGNHPWNRTLEHFVPLLKEFTRIHWQSTPTSLILHSHQAFLSLENHWSTLCLCKFSYSGHFLSMGSYYVLIYISLLTYTYISLTYKKIYFLHTHKCIPIYTYIYLYKYMHMCCILYVSMCVHRHILIYNVYALIYTYVVV